MSLNDMKDGLELNELPVADILNTIEKHGIGFKLDEPVLTVLFDAAKKGGRSSSETSSVLLKLLDVCLTCRDTFWPPFTAESLANFLAKKGSLATLDQLKVRGNETLPLNSDLIHRLLAAGANYDLIAEVQDRIQIPTPEGGYKATRLDKDSFDPSAKRGALTIDVVVDQDVVLYFRHNALFWRTTTKGHDPKILRSTYTSFGPMENDLDFFTANVTRTDTAGKKASILGGKPKELQVEHTPLSFPEGRPALKVTIANIDKSPQECILSVTWGGK